MDHWYNSGHFDVLGGNSSDACNHHQYSSRVSHARNRVGNSCRFVAHADLFPIGHLAHVQQLLTIRRW